MDEKITMIVATVAAFTLTAVLGFVIVPWLRKLKIGQTILEIGPKWHKSKEGTPTMGGLMFIIGTIAAFAGFIVPRIIKSIIAIENFYEENPFSTLSFDYNEVYPYVLISGIVMALAFGAVGFLDDYIKVVKKRNEGLNAIQKTVLQVAIILGYLIAVWNFKHGLTWLPFFGYYAMPWWLFFPFGFGVLYATTNAVNFTDGIDGLCTSVTVTSAAAFAILAYIVQAYNTAITALILLGACLGFLCWNFKPAKVIMGDTGSMFLGGMVIALAYALNVPIILLLFGIIYVIEGLSDVIQIGYYKATKDENGNGKRIFKMVPIHHHFELSGWSEQKIVFVFCAVNIVGIMLGFVLLKTGGYYA